MAALVPCRGRLCAHAVQSLPAVLANPKPNAMEQGQLSAMLSCMYAQV